VSARKRGVPGALASLVGDPVDVADVLAHLVADCAEATGAVAVAILANDAIGGYALLAATSHRASELEMLQAQQRTGPCVEAVDERRAVTSDSAGDMVDRWGDVGLAMTAAGCTAVESLPMLWRGQAVGGLNIFHDAARPAPDPDLTQAYADVATLVVVHSVVGHQQVRARIHDALAARTLIEQAKGVLAHAGQVDMETAYARLLSRAERDGVGLTETARDVVRRRGR
jgi:hypothetical protein